MENDLVLVQLNLHHFQLLLKYTRNLIYFFQSLVITKQIQDDVDSTKKQNHPNIIIHIIHIIVISRRVVILLWYSIFMKQLTFDSLIYSTTLHYTI